MRLMHFKIMSADAEELAVAVGRLVRVIAARLGLVQLEFHELPAEYATSSSAAKARPSEPDAARNPAATEAYLPIGPSCC